MPRVLTLILLLGCGVNTFAAEGPAYPLWNNTESVAEYARRVNLPPTQTLDLGNGVKLELVLIPAGKFMMGTPEPIKPEAAPVGQAIVGVGLVLMVILLLWIMDRTLRQRVRLHFTLRGLFLFSGIASLTVYGGVRWNESDVAWQQYSVELARYDTVEASEKPAHPVTLTKPFYTGKFAITQEQYQAVTGSNPSHFKGRDHPVERVSWNDAQEFCQMLARQTHRTVRLPTEAEWEFSCRAGTNTLYHSGDTIADLARVSWYEANANNTTHPVGEKEPNGFGLYDMLGNVGQWCLDRYSEQYYETSEAINPSGPAEGLTRALRGCSWGGNPKGCRSTDRIAYEPNFLADTLGFRIVVTVDSAP